ncbi:hypothetical protein G9A89_020407 [Geosiphon pyriformis]|nr:hypothetical protein G9A89_020407 [Geosiphon pyriformis]
MVSTYIAKIPEFTEKDSETSPQEWLDKVSKAGDANGWNAARMLKAIPYFLQEMNSLLTITLPLLFKIVITYLGKFNKLLRRIHQLETNKYYSNAQILDQFIARLKDKLIKKAKNYEMTIEEANHTKLVNLAIGETSSAAEEKIDQLTKKYQQPSTSQYQVPARRLIQHNQFTLQNRFSTNNNRLNFNNQLTTQNSNQHRSTYYHIQPSYLTIPEESNFQQTALFEDKAVAPRQNPFTNESPSLLSNVAVNKQKAITVMYTKAEVEGKPIHLILDSGSAGSIITYQLIQQLQQTVDKPAQTVIIMADGIKKTPVREIDNFPFTIDGITIPVKVLVMDAPQY